MPFILYAVGFFVLLAGMGFGAYLLDVPQSWTIVGSLIIVGAATMSSGRTLTAIFIRATLPKHDWAAPL